MNLPALQRSDGRSRFPWVFPWVLPGVELFYSGTHTDSEGHTQEYTPEMIEDMARNFPLLSAGERPVLVPPIGKGHDSAEAVDGIFETDATPSDGEVLRVWEEPTEIDGETVAMLKGDVAVSDDIAEMVNVGAFSRVSAEIDETPPPEGEAIGAKGWTLKRVAILGFAHPALKWLKPLPAPVAAFAEAWRRATMKRLFAVRGGTTIPKTILFSEAGRRPKFCNPTRGYADMSREEMIARLTELGVDATMIPPEVPDPVVQMILDLAEKAMGAKPPETPAGDMGMSDGARNPQQVVLKYKELEGQIHRLITGQKNDAVLRKAERRTSVRSFCEAKVKEGRLAPADIATDKDGNPLPFTALERLLEAAESGETRKFSEGGKTREVTRLEYEMETINRLPVRKFSEKVTSGGGDTADTSKLDAIIADVKSRYPAKQPAGNRILSKLGMRAGANRR